jgi:bifunctional DNA-binding transcriptional regulator/antitoxin component of YhaV-PrlF toxin-antitoxin module
MAMRMVSQKYQVTILKEIRDRLGIVPGQELPMHALDGPIRLSVPRSRKFLRGIAKGITWKDDDRDRHDRF